MTDLSPSFSGGRSRAPSSPSSCDSLPRLRLYRLGDLQRCRVQAQQAGSADVLGQIDEATERAWCRGPVWTLKRRDGTVIGVGGLYPIWPVPGGYRWQAFCFMGDPTPAELLAATRHVLAELAERPGRVEIDVAAEFRNGHRWARLLGFAVEGRAKNFRPDGGSVVRYARITRGVSDAA